MEVKLVMDKFSDQTGDLKAYWDKALDRLTLPNLDLMKYMLRFRTTLKAYCNELFNEDWFGFEI